VKWRVIRRNGPGDDLVELRVSNHAHLANPLLPSLWTARAVRYQRPGFPPQILLTSLLDPDLYPATEIAALYHGCWRTHSSLPSRASNAIEVRP